jgi:hypothetical protein
MSNNPIKLKVSKNAELFTDGNDTMLIFKVSNKNISLTNNMYTVKVSDVVNGSNSLELYVNKYKNKVNNDSESKWPTPVGYTQEREYKNLNNLSSAKAISEMNFQDPLNLNFSYLNKSHNEIAQNAIGNEVLLNKRLHVGTKVKVPKRGSYPNTSNATVYNNENYNGQRSVIYDNGVIDRFNAKNIKVNNSKGRNNQLLNLDYGDNSTSSYNYGNLQLSSKPLEPNVIKNNFTNGIVYWNTPETNTTSSEVRKSTVIGENGNSRSVKWKKKGKSKYNSVNKSLLRRDPEKPRSL